MRDRGLSLLIIEHETEEMRECDRIVVLRDGKVIAEGTPEMVLRDTAMLAECGIRPPALNRVLAQLGIQAHARNIDEAEALIRQVTAERHGAPYYLVQTVLIQDLSLHNAQRRITDLETQLTETKLNSPAVPSFLGGPSFLGAVFDRSEPSRDVRQINVPPGGLATGPLRSRRCSNRVLFPSPPTRHLSLLAPD
jgi:hypothetical protein